MNGPMSSRDVRDHNLGLVLTTLGDGAGHSRSDLTRETGLTAGAVTSLVNELISAGLVRTVAAEDTKRPLIGRRKDQLFLGCGGYAAAAIELSLDGIRTWVETLSGKSLLDNIQTISFRDRAPSDFADQAARTIAGIMARLDQWNIVHLPVVGIVVPAPILEDGSTVYAALDFRWNDPFDLRSMIERRLAEALPSGAQAPRIVLFNDGHCATWAEYEHLRVSFPDNAPRNLMYVKAVNGIGGGVIIDGRPYSGSSGFAFIPGHTPVDPDGPPCGCGQRGCLATIAGIEPILNSTGLTDYDREHGRNAVVEELLRREKAGDPTVLAVAQRSDRAIRTMLEAMCIAFAPDIVVLGGYLPRRLDALSDLNPAALRGIGRGAFRGRDAIIPAHFGADAAITGAMMQLRAAVLRAMPSILRGEEW